MVNRPKIHRLVRTNHIAGLSPAANLSSHKRDSILDSARLVFFVYADLALVAWRIKQKTLVSRDPGSL